MKKKSFFIKGMLAIVLALVFTGCDNDTTDNGTNTDPKTIVITGIADPPDNSQDWVTVGLFRDNSLWHGGTLVHGDSSIVDHEVTIDLYHYTYPDGQTSNRWTGTGEWFIRLKFLEEGTNLQRDFIWKENQMFDIKDTVTVLNFSDFVLVWTED
jgi:hypothetical protein